ncbi:type VI secretion system baseplate subunit TssK [Photorhabdus cinerea]|uniref:Type VI secretion system baseplate subunit TssK n=1 Tax=Photorhabdus cinerea TaxID=471575 RepID=A0A7X5QBA7_9GAMM|nr:type VI secretion system baseplate subunit TssK [Photorhabdus cinerea]NHB91183.1 type VI secretion system baseplate subunit TssK [Photorhabdus cinerea]
MFEHKPMYWYSGLYLQPQHFQAHELQHEYWQGRYQLLTQPYAFGVVRLVFNLAALSDEVLSVHKAAFVFPDGCYVDCDVNGVLSARSLRDCWPEREKPQRIYIGLRTFNHNQSNVTGVADATSVGDITSRWVTWPQEQRMRDAFGEGPEAEVQQLTYNLRFFLHDEIAQATGYTLLPVGQLRCTGDGIELDNRYLPPCLTLYAVPQLGQRIEQLCQELTGRVHQLEELKRPQTLEAEVYTQEKSTLLLTLRTLVRYVVQLYHCQETRDVHPLQIFGLLRQLISELSCFTDRCSFLGEWNGREGTREKYQHLDLALTLNNCERTIIDLLNALVLEPNTVIPLQQEYSGYYHAAFNVTGASEQQRIYLVLRSDSLTHSEREIPDDRLIKLAAAEQIDGIINRALPGVRLYYQEIAPHGLPNRMNTRYFRVENRGALWRQVEDSERVAVHWADAPDDLQIEIVIVRVS